MPLAQRSDVNPAFSLPSILAVVAAVVSFKAGAFLGTLLAIAAIVLGLLGAVLAISPRVRGGMISLLSIVAGVIGIIAAVFKLVF
jgi:uncharacterized membrane protein